MRVMLCVCAEQNRDHRPIIDLDTILQDYAWRELKRDARWYQGPLLRSCYVIEIPWNFYEFEHTTTKFSPRLNNPASRDGFRERKQVELFSTNYKNNTGKEQIYNLKTQRQTQARTNVSFQRGFVIKGAANFKLKIPDQFGHCGVTATADGHLRVTKRGESIDEMFTWQCDSDITVDPYHITKVTLVVTEDEFMADFEVRTKMRMPTGEAPIILKRKCDNHISAVLLLSDLRQVFSELGSPFIHVVKSDNSAKSDNDIEFVTTGVLESIRWRDQRICIESRPIGPSESTIECPYDVPLYSKDIYSRVIKHATKEAVGAEKGGPVKEHQNKDNKESKEQQFKGFKVETKDLRFSIIPKIVTESPDEVFAKDEASSIDETTLMRSVFPTIRLQEKGMKSKEPPDEDDDDDTKPPPPYKSSFDMPLQVIHELSLEDKEDTDKIGTPDSSDSQKFAKVTSV